MMYCCTAYEVGLFLSLPTSQPFLLTLQAEKLKSCTVGDTSNLCKVLPPRIPESCLGGYVGHSSWCWLPSNITGYAVGLHGICHVVSYCFPPESLNPSMNVEVASHWVKFLFNPARTLWSKCGTAAICSCRDLPPSWDLNFSWDQ